MKCDRVRQGDIHHLLHVVNERADSQSANCIAQLHPPEERLGDGCRLKILRSDINIGC